jgi:uncharacterized protein
MAAFSDLIGAILCLCMLNCRAFHLSLKQIPFHRYSLSMSSTIRVEKNPSQEKLEKLGVRGWSTWGCGVSIFPWTYSDTETSYILQGKVVVTPSPSNGSDAVTIEAGDLVVFPEGLSCVWDVKEPIQKHYNFS